MFGRIIRRIRAALVRRLIPAPVKTRHWEYSGVYYVEPIDCPPEKLIQLALEAIQQTPKVDLFDLQNRVPAIPYLQTWPGEHYKLLAGFMRSIGPKVVVEIGTHLGLSALTMKKFLPANAKLITYDVIPWDQFTGTALLASDFKTGHFEQRICDLSSYEAAVGEQSVLREADFIFVDAAKDGKMEDRFLNNFKAIGLKSGAIVMFDDIRLWNMLSIWQNIKYPKIDLTSFGHWSGTGLFQIP